MNPFRLFNPFYVLRLERDLAGYVSSVDRLVAIAESMAERAGEGPDVRLVNQMRESLKSVAEAMASGRTGDAKTMVDAIILILEPKEKPRG